MLAIGGSVCDERPAGERVPLATLYGAAAPRPLSSSPLPVAVPAGDSNCVVPHSQARLPFTFPAHPNCCQPSLAVQRALRRRKGRRRRTAWLAPCAILQSLPEEAALLVFDSSTRRVTTPRLSSGLRQTVSIMGSYGTFPSYEKVKEYCQDALFSERDSRRFLIYYEEVLAEWLVLRVSTVSAYSAQVTLPLHKRLRRARRLRGRRCVFASA